MNPLASEPHQGNKHVIINKLNVKQKDSRDHISHVKLTLHNQKNLAFHSSILAFYISEIKSIQTQETQETRQDCQLLSLNWHCYMFIQLIIYALVLTDVQGFAFSWLSM